MMDLYELKELFVDDSQLVELYDTDADESFYLGELSEMPDEFEGYTVCSIDSLYPRKDFDGRITINIEGRS